MATVKGNGSFYKRKVGKYEYFVAEKTIGSETYTAYSSKSYKEANVKLLKKLPIQKAEDIKLKDFLIQWLEFKKDKVKIRTWQTYQYHVERVVQEIGDMKIGKITTLDLENMYSDFGVSAKTIKNIHLTLHAALDYAKKHDILQVNVSDNCELPKVYHKEMNILSTEEIKFLLKVAEGTRIYLPIYVVLHTGMRQGEVLALRGKNILDNAISVTRNMVMVRKDEDVKQHVEFGPPKNGTSRIVSVKPEVIEKLKALNKKPTQLLFPSEAYTPWQTRNFNRLWFSIRKKAGLEHIRFHDLRHTHISYLLANGADIVQVAARVGHKDPSITAKIYAHVIKGRQTNILDFLPEPL